MELNIERTVEDHPMDGPTSREQDIIDELLEIGVLDETLAVHIDESGRSGSRMDIFFPIDSFLEEVPNVRRMGNNISLLVVWDNHERQNPSYVSFGVQGIGCGKEEENFKKGDLKELITKSLISQLEKRSFARGVGG